jgi:hypothetical protein
MYVATKPVGTPLGVMGNGVPAAPGLGLMPNSQRTGDYSSVEVDPTDGTTFWAANEYIGADGAANIWRTHIDSFQATVDPGADIYSVRVKGGDPVDIAVTVPGAGPGQFVNAFVPAVYLYDPGGHLVALDEAQDSNNQTVTIHFRVPTNGQGRYTIRVAPSPLTPQPTQGEYALVVSGGEDEGARHGRSRRDGHERADPCRGLGSDDRHRGGRWPRRRQPPGRRQWLRRCRPQQWCFVAVDDVHLRDHRPTRGPDEVPRRRAAILPGP